MKKRIISLILVVVLTAFALTGCAFNYARANLSKYATFDGGFKDAIWNLSIKDGSFGHDPEVRWDKVEEAIIAELLSKASADTDNKHYEGKPDAYDYLAYCYYAVYTDENGVDHILFTSKMDESAIKPSTKVQVIQLGNPSLEGFNKLVSDAILGLENDSITFYSTSVGTTILAKGDKVAVSYTKTQQNAPDENDPQVEKYQQVVTVGDGSDLGDFLLGKKVGVTLEGTFVATETPDSAKPEITIDWEYSDIKVEQVLDGTTKVSADDVIYITYTKKVEYKYDGEGENVVVSVDGYKSAGSDIFTVSFTQGMVDLQNPGKDTEFFAQLVGKEVGKLLKSDGKTSEEIKINETINVTVTVDGGEPQHTEETVSVSYTDINIHWIVNSEHTEAVTVTHKPTDSKATDINGVEITDLSKKDLTYYIFPVYYTKVDNVEIVYNEDPDKMTYTGINAETFIRDLLSVVTAQITEEHDEEAEHDHDSYKKYDFISAIEASDFKTADGKTIKELINTLHEANSALTTAQKALDTALTTLLKAASGVAKAEIALAEAEEALNEAAAKFATAKTEHEAAKAAVAAAEEAVANAGEDEKEALEAALADAQADLETKKTAEDTANRDHSKANDAHEKAVASLKSANEAYETEADKYYGEKGVQVALDDADAKVEETIAAILSCTAEGKTLETVLNKGYAKYHYDKLETAYKKEITTNVINALVTLAQSCISYDKLPKRAVRQAKKALINTYKYAYYEGTTGSGENAVSNFSQYDSFDAYLKAAVESELKATAGSMTDDDVDAYIEAQAEKTVRELILVYTLAEELDLELTRKEKKEHKKYYKDKESMLQQYGTSYGYIIGLLYGVDPSTQTVQDYLNAKQFDKVMNYLLEIDENAGGLEVKFAHVGYTYIEAEEK